MTTGLEVENAIVRYRPEGGGARAQTAAAVAGVSFGLAPGETVGLVGESGCGKSSLARAILGLVPLAGGSIRWRGRRIDQLGRRQWRDLRRELQLVFQDPFGCLDPRMTVCASIAEPLRALCPELSAAERRQRVAQLLGEVGLAAELAARYPHELSGGQLQRVGVARALATDPRLLVCDEPVSALDVSVQAQIVALLARIRGERALATLFISHNLAIVARLCDRVLVMYLGRIVEQADCRALLAAPRHPYTRLLLDAVPAADPGWWQRNRQRFTGAAGLPASAAGAGPGCAFAPRCAQRIARCAQESPPLAAAGAGRWVACHRPQEWPGGL